MRVLCLIPYLHDTVPGQRFRIEQWQSLLSHDGIVIDFQPFESPELHAILPRGGAHLTKAWLMLKAFGRRLRLLTRVTDYDAVFLFREAAFVGPALLERWIHWRGVPIIFDYDDAIWIPQTSGANGLMTLAKCVGKTRTIARLSTHVTPGNDYLAAFARQYARNVTIVPTTIDTDKYVVRRPVPDRDPVVIGWSGSYSTVRYVEALREPLRDLARTERFRVRIIGGEIEPIPGVDVECVPWRSAAEVEDLNQIDIGVMPLTDDEWARGKCGLKALQYMALGIPTTCSPVGVNSQIISHDVNGLLATTREEWTEALRSLIRRPELRHRLGLRGRATVEEKYSAQSQVPRLRQILEQAVAERRGAPSGVLHSRTGQ